METIRLDLREDGVAVVTLARPPVNAVSRQMMVELTSAFEDLSVDTRARVIVLAAEGDRAFCGGVELREMGSDTDPARGDVQSILNPGHLWRNTQHVVRHVSVPVIAAVERPAVGAGFGLVALADIVVASKTASFGLTEINVGLLGGASKAMRMFGPYKARMMMFTGRMQGADELFRRGVLEELVEPGQALDSALSIATEIARKSPLAMRLAKESILRIETDVVEDQYRTEWDYTNRLRTFNDSAEAMSAYLEKREPHWTWT